MILTLVSPINHMVINRAAIRERLKAASNIIQFRVFCCACRHTYVWNVGTGEESERVIIESIKRALRCIVMWFRDTVTGIWKNITPDMVYKRTNQYIDVA